MEASKRHEICSFISRDRLSNLPQPVLHTIFSFLDMKYVIPTSILARSWRNLWHSLPFLAFNAHVYHSCVLKGFENYRYKEFTDFVNMVLFLRNASPIQSFKLIWFDYSSKKLDHIDQWIRTAVLRKVKEINVQLLTDRLSFEFPSCLFTSESLTSLSLYFRDDSDVTTKVTLPNRISLPSLKSLHLALVDVSAYDNFFDILFTGCPALETLSLLLCQFTSSKISCISSPQLKHLDIDLTYADNKQLEVFLINTPNLRHYYWRSLSWSAFSLEGFSSLETAEIDTGECYNSYNCKVQSKDSKYLQVLDSKAIKWMMACLKALQNVKHLTLSADFLQLISEHPSESEKWPTVFSNLKYLNLQTWLTRGCFEATMALLNNSPNIETLVVNMDPIDSEKIKEHRLEFSLKKLHHLKVVKLENASGCKNELQHLRVLLGVAEALEKIIIFIKSRRVKILKEWRVFTSEVLALPRASQDIRIIFRTVSAEIDS